jgi:hypothetical protein
MSVIVSLIHSFTHPLTSSPFLLVIISVKNLVDLYGKDELIYLGPDEQVRKKTLHMNRIVVM